MLSRSIAAMAALVTPVIAGAQAPANWSGFYVGAEAGGANARMKVSGTDQVSQLTNEHPAPPGSPANPLIVVPGTTKSYAGSDSSLSFLYGAFAGGQWQIGSVVLGVEGDVHGPRDSARFAVQQTIPATLLAPPSTLTQARALDIRYDWSARARLGIVIGRSLLYATGGVAQTKIRMTGEDSFFTPAGAAASELPPVPTFQSPAIGPVVTTFTRDARLTGWTAGIGGEHRIASHLSLGLDARYLDFGSHTISFDCGLQSAKAGTCGSYATPPIVIYGRTYGVSDTSPGVAAGPTRTSLTEWRLAARLVFHF